jgi:hypothetical protein
VARAAPAALIMVEVRIGEAVPFAECEELRSAGAMAFVAVDHHAPDLELLMTAARAASASLRGQIAPRLRLLGHPIPARFELVLELLVAGPAYWRATQWAAAAGGSIRTLERRCAEVWHVPSPRKWVELVRAIHAIQAVQARSKYSLELALTEGGLGSARTARQLVKKVSGASPARSRGLVGWYWAIESWCAGYW